MATYVCSDLHLNHYNILSLESYNLKKNGYDYINTIEDYNEMIIRNINAMVNPSDTLYILGDFAFGNYHAVSSLVHRINGYKIFIMGNHDRYSPEEAVQMGFNEAYRAPMYLPESGGRIIICHYPVYECKDNPYIAYCLHGHLHGSKLNLPNFINVNIAMNDYKPLPMEPFLKKIEMKCKSRKEKWLQEWYAGNQIFQQERQNLVLYPNKLLNVEETLKLQSNNKK